ncbi:MAG: methyltransferase domain-containing protein [Verrucomicrobia bacterium]|nr:methyltransferase domain-containing protein [Verrucomicrobiota bacterium]
MKTNLVRFAHDFARERLKTRNGFFAVDATAGNGHDTLFLAQLAGENGRVAAFDVQPEAIEATRERLQKNNAPANVDLFLCGHENMAERLPENWRGNVHAVFFNLGYLPRSTRQIKTHAETTLRALDCAWNLLAPGGFISLAVYTRHEGGFDESARVSEWLERLRSRAEIFSLGEHNPVEPWWAGIVKKV